ncbi:MAG: dihydrofolate reductase family protein [Acidobacteriota bacterium]
MTLSPYVTELDHPAEGMVAVGSGWSRALFDGPFYLSPGPTPRRPATSLVFVQSSDGNTVASDPALLGGGDTDKHLIYEGLSRVAADAVLAGADTVRHSRVVFSVWHPELVGLRASLGLPRHPVQIVATIHGVDVDDALLFNVPDISVLLLTLAPAARQMGPALRTRPWITALLMDRPEDLPRVFEQLGSLGIARLSCVGGHVLAGHLLDAGLIDDVYLTTGLRAGGEPGTPLRSTPWRRRVVVRKRGTGAEAGVIFEHLVPA